MSVLPERIFLVFLFAFCLFAESSRALYHTKGKNGVHPQDRSGWAMMIFLAEAEEDLKEENQKTVKSLILNSAESGVGFFFRKFDLQTLLSAGKDSLSALCCPLHSGRLFLFFAGVLLI
jgi:hypothetical protein